MDYQSQPISVCIWILTLKNQGYYYYYYNELPVPVLKDGLALAALSVSEDTLAAAVAGNDIMVSDPDLMLWSWMILAEVSGAILAKAQSNLS